MTARMQGFIVLVLVLMIAFAGTSSVSQTLKNWLYGIAAVGLLTIGITQLFNKQSRE